MQEAATEGFMPREEVIARVIRQALMATTLPQTAEEVRAIKPELSRADQDRYDRIMLYIVDEQKKGNTSWVDGNRLLFGYPQLWNKLKENGFEVLFDNGKRFWTKNVPSYFTVSWETSNCDTL